MPKTVPNSSKLITDIRHKVLYFFIGEIERLRTSSVRTHSFMSQMVHSGRLFTYEGGNQRET